MPQHLALLISIEVHTIIAVIAHNDQIMLNTHLYKPYNLFLISYLPSELFLTKLIMKLIDIDIPQ